MSEMRCPHGNQSRKTEGKVKDVLFGLTVESGNQTIMDKVFDKAHEARYFSLSTLPAQGSLPGSRFLDFMRSASDGLLYFGVGTGKPCNEDIEAHPVVTLNGSFVGEDTGESEHRRPPLKHDIETLLL